MSWLTNFVRPKLRALVSRADVPDNLWNKCPQCDQMIFHRDLEKNLHVCQHCGHHMRIPAAKRLEILFDDGAYQRVAVPETPDDPLNFRDRRRYTERLKEARGATKERDAVVVATGTIGGHPTVIAVLTFEFRAGSMGIAAGSGIVAAARRAVSEHAPLIAITASGGARMQEGILSLMQLPRTVAAIQEVKEAGLPYFVLLTDPTTGGVSASFAMLGDIHLAEPGTTIGFAGRRVIEQTVRETLPEKFQTAEFLLEHGMIDCVVPRAELRGVIARLIDLLCSPRPETDSGNEDATLQIPESRDTGATNGPSQQIG